MTQHDAGRGINYTQGSDQFLILRRVAFNSVASYCEPGLRLSTSFPSSYIFFMLFDMMLL